MPKKKKNKPREIQFIIDFNRNLTEETQPEIHQASQEIRKDFNPFLKRNGQKVILVTINSFFSPKLCEILTKYIVDLRSRLFQKKESLKRREPPEPTIPRHPSGRDSELKSLKEIQFQEIFKEENGIVMDTRRQVGVYFQNDVSSQKDDEKKGRGRILGKKFLKFNEILEETISELKHYILNKDRESQYYSQRFYDYFFKGLPCLSHKQSLVKREAAERLKENLIQLQVFSEVIISCHKAHAPSISLKMVFSDSAKLEEKHKRSLLEKDSRLREIVNPFRVKIRSFEAVKNLFDFTSTAILEECALMSDYTLRSDSSEKQLSGYISFRNP